jgi:uncharacterized protein
MIDLPAHQLDTVKLVLNAIVPGVSVYAFGSRVSGRAKRHSDLDLALQAEDALNWRQLAQLREAFEESDLPIRVDIVDWAACSPQFKACVSAMELIAPK